MAVVGDSSAGDSPVIGVVLVLTLHAKLETPCRRRQRPGAPHVGAQSLVDVVVHHGQLLHEMEDLDLTLRQVQGGPQVLVGHPVNPGDRRR